MQFSTVVSVAFVALANFVAAESAAAVSQITDGQIQATTATTTATTAAPSTTTTAAVSSSTVETVSASSTETVSQQTENGAAKAAVGMGAGALAAAALLL
ncbi:hypothetical protein N7582_003438 [Saccharomyces uvarum]|uniref:Uncharacterized protein n=1 Tax=Saccharomyces uvarum TaxID=230603 RepID=A0AA35J3S7_SACUV|nr:hypothetical protein N7582_003438 [Saccharomyces uvarum]CAI4045104.1 hypothetical protein SUVC_11G1220 [Saccharomyces uvarum]